uniref:Uncharacterized protein n=1 Tax=Opuntia streptacantha TaxID=393608 RepID=A0A7C9D636_OPUST
MKMKCTFTLYNLTSAVPCLNQFPMIRVSGHLIYVVLSPVLPALGNFSGYIVLGMSRNTSFRILSIFEEFCGFSAQSKCTNLLSLSWLQPLLQIRISKSFLNRIASLTSSITNVQLQG